MDVKTFLNHEIVEGSVWAMPSDTIYGLSCKASDVQACKRINTIKNRAEGKSYIVLVASLAQLERFGVDLSHKHESFLNHVWPGPVSVVLPANTKSYKHLVGEQTSIAFRLPADEELRTILSLHGPLVSTSINKSGEESLQTIDTIRSEFGSDLDFIVEKEDYQPQGASTLISILR